MNDGALFDLPAGSFRPRARVVLLAGPSGSGKTALARRTGLPSLSLDNFYRDEDFSGMPHLANGLIDWDDPASWDSAGAIEFLEELCLSGRATGPVYDIPSNRRTGTKAIDIGDHNLVLAEGIFASEIIAPLQERGLLAEAICIARSPLRNGWFRLQRDLAEGRKPVPVLLARGARLMVQEPGKIKAWVAAGCAPVRSLEEAEGRIGARGTIGS